MPENNFEQQVKQKTDELRLNPSGEVWQRLSLAITKRKRDRRVLGVILLFLLIGGAFMIVSPDQNHLIKINRSVAEKTNPVNSDNVKKNQHQEKIAQVNIGTNNSKNSQKTVSNIDIIKQSAPSIHGIHTQQKNTLAYVPVSEHASVTKAEVKNPVSSPFYKVKTKSNRLAEPPIYKSHSLKTLVTQSGPEELENEIASAAGAARTSIDQNFTHSGDVKNQRINDTARNVQNDTIKQKNSLSKIPDAGVKPAASKKPGTSQQNSRWRVGLGLSLGLSANKNGYFGIGGVDESKALDPSPVYTGNTGTGNYNSSPSKIKTGAGFIARLFLEKNISHKTILLFGLNYKRYSSSMVIGDMVDSTAVLAQAGGPNNLTQVSSFYRTGNSIAYTNHFHFIEIPVGLKFKVGNGNIVPLYLSAGVTVSRLLASNALQFDPSAGSYYKNNKLLNRMQYSVSGGLLVALPAHARDPFLIGPDMNFSLRKMAGSGLYNNRHYSYFGIQVQKIIGKNFR